MCTYKTLIPPLLAISPSTPNRTYNNCCIGLVRSSMGFLRDEGMVYEPVDEVDLGPNSDYSYVEANIKAPRMAGLLVKASARVLEFPILGGIILYFLKRSNKVHKFISFAEFKEPPLFVPVHPYQENVETQVIYVEPDLPPPEKVRHAVDCLQSSKDLLKNPRLSFQRWTIMDYAKAYTSGETTPTIVAKRFIASARESSSKELQMSFFINYDVEDILKQAEGSTLRYKKGEPLSVLDGVLVAIKDEIDCLPYPTTGGSKWLHHVRQCKKDACCVSRLRLCGAITVGKANMQELGAGVSGINPHYGACRNPYDRSKITGGSSSGSAAVVAAGLCPVALGVDGGGSVRIPAAICGVVGLKPTFARVPHDGVIPIHYTVGNVGILAATVEDAMIAYAAISGGISVDLYGIPVPKIGLPLLGSTNNTIRMARYEKWFNDCSGDIKSHCYNVVAELTEKYGWEIIDVTIPDIEAMRLAHYLTLGSECSGSVARYLEKQDPTESGSDTRVALAFYGSFDSHEYLNAQKLRNRQLQFHHKIFDVADVIVTPTIGMIASSIPNNLKVSQLNVQRLPCVFVNSVTAYSIQKDCLKTGELDYINGAALLRYMVAGNFLGLPAVTVPVGYDKSGLPIGLQFMGKPWSESLLIHMASSLQALGLSGSKKPEVFYDLLAEE